MGDVWGTLGKAILAQEGAQVAANVLGHPVSISDYGRGSSYSVSARPQQYQQYPQQSFQGGGFNAPRPRAAVLDNRHVPELALIDLAAEMSIASRNGDQAAVGAIAQEFAATAKSLTRSDGRIHLPELPPGASPTFRTNDGVVVRMPQSGTPAEYAATLLTQLNGASTAITAVNSALGGSAAAPAPAPGAAPAAVTPPPAPAAQPATPPAPAAPSAGAAAGSTPIAIAPANDQGALAKIYGKSVQGHAPTLQASQVASVQRAIQLALGEDGVGKHGPDGKWGPATQHGFEAICQNAGIEAKSVDFTKLDDPNTQKFLAEAKKEADARVTAARGAAQSAPAAAPAAPAADQPAPTAAVAANAALAPVTSVSQEQFAGKLNDFVTKMVSAMSFDAAAAPGLTATQQIERQFATVQGVVADNKLTSAEAVAIGTRLEAEAKAGPENDKHKDMRVSFEQLLDAAGITRQSYGAAAVDGAAPVAPAAASTQQPTRTASAGR